MKECGVSGCPRPYHANGYCGMHAQRLRRTGDPLGMRRRPLDESFWAQVDKSGDCWLWTGSINKSTGYGGISTRKSPSGGTSRLAHRVSYEMVYGEIPKGLHLDHLCRVRHCVNPAHLEPVTPVENARRGLHGILRTHCEDGHELSGDNLLIVNGTTRRCRTCDNARTRKYRNTDEYRDRKRKPCRRCGGPKGPGRRVQLCAECRAKDYPDYELDRAAMFTESRWI